MGPGGNILLARLLQIEMLHVLNMQIIIIYYRGKSITERQPAVKRPCGCSGLRLSSSVPSQLSCFHSFSVWSTPVGKLVFIVFRRVAFYMTVSIGRSSEQSEVYTSATMVLQRFSL